MSTMAGRQINVMMRLKTCTRAINTIYKYCLKYVQKLRINCEGKVNYIVIDHAANF